MYSESQIYAYNLSVSFLDRFPVASCSFNRLHNLNCCYFNDCYRIIYDPMYENPSFSPWIQRSWRCSHLRLYPTLLLRSTWSATTVICTYTIWIRWFVIPTSYFFLNINISGAQINLISNTPLDSTDSILLFN